MDEENRERAGLGTCGPEMQADFKTVLPEGMQWWTSMGQYFPT